MRTASQGGEWSLRRLLTEVLGSGPNTADDMGYGQARSAMAQVLDREADPTTLGAFLLAARWKENTPEELAGFLDELRDRAELAEPGVAAVDCGANYDGKRETALLGVAAGAVSAAAGVPVVLHAGVRLPAKRADTYTHVLEALGITTDLDPSVSTRMVEETGVGFYYQPRFAPALEAIRGRREALGVRTPINTVETLLNPSAATTHLGSFFHRTFGERVIETLRASRTLDVERALMLQGLEGYDDLRPGRTAVVEWRDGALEEWVLEPAEFGLALDRGALAVGDVAEDSAAITAAVLAGDRSRDVSDAVALNAAVRIYAGGGADTIEAGLDVAQNTLRDGAAQEVLEALRAFEP